MIGGARVRTGANQQPRSFEIIPASGPVQRCGAVRLSGIHVGLSREQRPNRVGIAIHHRIGDVARVSRTRGDQQKCKSAHEL